jgi:transcriptional regulator with XRE-family HTH domain
MRPETTGTAGIGARVRAARERLGWTREALAFHSGLSWAAIGQVESSRRTNLRPSTLAALSRSLGVSIDYLVDGFSPRPPMLKHALFSYSSDDQFRSTTGPFLAEGIERFEALIAVTTPANIELLHDHLGRDARAVEFVDASDFYRTPGAALERYRGFADARLADGAPWVRVVGEPVWAGRSKLEAGLWTRYESLLNLVLSAYPLTVLCPYDERSVAPEVVRQAHLTHPSNVGADGVSDSPKYVDPGRFALEL